MIWAAVLAIVMLLALIGASYCFFLLACDREGGPFRRASARRGPDAFSLRLMEYQDVMDAGRAWIDKQPWEEWTIRSRDGLRLRARYLPAPGAKRVFLLAHGYRSSGARDFSAAARPIFEMGSSLLLIDQRAHGQSEGRYITFGALESQDVADWALELERRVSLPIYLDGVSMGAATVLMAGAREMPASLAGVVADCGYTTPEDELRHVLVDRMRMRPFPLLPLVRLWARLLAGFDLRAASATEGAAAMRAPVLFAHGLADTLVPSAMSERNFKACRAPKDIFLVPGAEHGMSYLLDPEGYTLKLQALLRAGGEDAAGPR